MSRQREFETEEVEIELPIEKLECKKKYRFRWPLRFSKRCDLDVEFNTHPRYRTLFAVFTQFSIADFGKNDTLELQFKTHLVRDSDGLACLLQDEWSEVCTFGEYGGRRYRKLYHEHKGNMDDWGDCKLVVKVRQLIDLPPPPPPLPALPVAKPGEHLKRSLEKTFESGDFSDFTVKCDKKDWKVHKNILAAQSDVFKAAIENDFKEREDGVYEIKDVKPEVVEKFLRYFYTGDAKDVKPVAGDLLKLAAQYFLQELVDMCVNAMSGELTIESAIECLSLADRYEHLAEFKQRVLAFTKQNIEKIKQQPEWTAFTREHGGIVGQLV